MNTQGSGTATAKQCENVHMQNICSPHLNIESGGSKRDKARTERQTMDTSLFCFNPRKMSGRGEGKQCEN